LVGVSGRVAAFGQERTLVRRPRGRRNIANVTGRDGSLKSHLVRVVLLDLVQYRHNGSDAA
jgi:hypothetical protein